MQGLNTTIYFNRQFGIDAEGNTVDITKPPVTQDLANVQPAGDFVLFQEFDGDSYLINNNQIESISISPYLMEEEGDADGDTPAAEADFENEGGAIVVPHRSVRDTSDDAGSTSGVVSDQESGSGEDTSPEGGAT